MSLRSRVFPLLLIGATVICVSAVAQAEAPLNLERTNGIVYGQRNGRDLTMDIVRPSKPNGLAVAAIVSGGWQSQPPGGAPDILLAPIAKAGYTVFAICHISQPESKVPEIIQDIHRGIRFVRYHADKYSIDPDRIGVTGASAGGHLSLMLATTGGPGPSDADDPIDRESSAVQAVAIFFPATDLVNLGSASINPGDGGPPLGYEAAFGLKPGDKEGWDKINQQVSPIFHVKQGLPPTLIYHGDQDELVPLDQSQRFQAKSQEWNNKVKLVVREGLAHGWLTIPVDMKAFADWYDKHLLGHVAKTKVQATEFQPTDQSSP